MLNYQIPLIMMINASTSIVKNNELDEPYHNVLNELSNALSTVPFFELQQIKLTEKNIRLVEVNGKEVNLGDFSNIGEKMRSFKYFLGSEAARKKRMILSIYNSIKEL